MEHYLDANQKYDVKMGNSNSSNSHTIYPIIFLQQDVGIPSNVSESLSSVSGTFPLNVTCKKIKRAEGRYTTQMKNHLSSTPPLLIKRMQIASSVFISPGKPLQQ